MEQPVHSCDQASGELLLDIQGLRTWFYTRDGIVKAVDGVSLQLRRGEILGLVGESGSGKSVMGFSIMGLVGERARVHADRMMFDGHDLLKASDEAMRRLRGDRLSMIFQDPMMTLNPTLRVDTQMIEAVRAHNRVSRQAARQHALDVLRRVGIPAPEARLQLYPHHLSGGMRQRIAIAIALLNAPKLIIADEPTTALDVTIQGQILYEVQKLCREMGTALIWITHDLALVSGLADRMAVMYAGRIVESTTTDMLIGHARHPYTHGLMASIPSLATRGEPLFQIPGSTPSLLHLPKGCSFRTRCYRADGQCEHAPELRSVMPGHSVSCWHDGAQT